MIRILLILLPFGLLCQSYHPAAGINGSNAVDKDSSIILGWATGIDLQRGYFEIPFPQTGTVTFGQPENALYQAEGDGTSVVSLGDSGVAVLTFDYPISDGPGYDLAVFENSFGDDFLEFAFVEVSSDGLHFFRFASHCEWTQPVNSFGTVDCRFYNNLAGKYRQGFGTPFDLSEIPDQPNFNRDAITHVRIIDVIGTDDPNFATFDSFGNAVLDPYPTGFESGGFDLDGVAILNSLALDLQYNQPTAMKIYPNPAQNVLHLSGLNPIEKIAFYELSGKMIFQTDYSTTIDISGLAPGVYFVQQAENLVRLVKE